MRAAKIFALSVLLAGASFPVVAGWRDFLPRAFDNGAYLDLFASYEQDDNRNDAQEFDWRDTFLKEKITWFGRGYIYHPRFLLYDISLAEAVKQEDYAASFVDSPGWQSASGLEYDTRLSFLPQHPYNLQLFAQRYEPLFKEQSSDRRNDVETRWGGMFRYRKKPYFFHARYTEDEVQSGVTTSDVRRVGVGGEYFRQYGNGIKYSLTADYNPRRFSNSSGLGGSSTERLLGSSLDLRRVRFRLSVSENDTDQDSASAGGYANDQEALYGVVTAYFPKDLRGDLSYRYQDNTSEIRDAAGFQDRELSDTSRILELDLVHRLYESLDTRYVFRRNERTSSSGDSTALSNTLGVDYTKLIPRGRILAGIDLGRTDTDNTGTADVASEPHPSTAVPGSFVLGQENAERSSIVIFLQSPLAPFETVTLDEGAHYTVTPDSNTFRIDVLTLPSPFVVPGDYDLFASYTLETGTFGLRTDTAGYNASVELLDNLLTPYYSYLSLRSEETSGMFPGIPIDSTTHTVGLRVQHGPLRGRGEYQRVDWEVSPYRAWRGELQSVGSVTSTTSLYVNLSYLNKHFPEGRPGQSDEAFTETTASLSGNVRRRFAHLGMLLSAGGSIAYLRGLFESRAYSLNSSLSWRVGKMDLAVGATAYGSHTDVEDGLSNTRGHQYYYIKIRRELF